MMVPMTVCKYAVLCRAVVAADWLEVLRYANG
jgi:hypothetical protein